LIHGGLSHSKAVQQFVVTAVVNDPNLLPIG